MTNIYDYHEIDNLKTPLYYIDQRLDKFIRDWCNKNLFSTSKFINFQFIKLIHDKFKFLNKSIITHNSNRIYNEKLADFIINIVFSKEHILELYYQNDNKKNYIIIFRIDLQEDTEFINHEFFKLKNIIFWNYDLRDYFLLDDNCTPLRGVTMPTPYRYCGKQRIISPINNYLITFRGNCNQCGWYNSCKVRKNLKKLCSNKYDMNKYNIIYEDTSDNIFIKSKKKFDDMLLNSTFAFVLHGDGRWSYRFLEVLGSGAIPVLISDGITLPLDNLIDYNKFIIRIPESAVNNATNIKDILNFLPKDNITITNMMNYIKYTYNKYFTDNNYTFEIMLKLSQKIIKD